LTLVNIYMVGGAVRDELLGLPVSDHDWVVTGATPEQMLSRGFRQVGRDFPVFLHPQTAEEYALARTERKTGPGYHGFVVNSAPDVTLEQDLARRDLTINAMARDTDGRLIDPYDGQADVERRLLRHVSPAFSEDPLRVLRVARFAARFDTLGFHIAAETKRLMTDMVNSGELTSLAAERVWQECQRALAGPCPARFFTVLRECGALAVVLPEVDRLFGVPQPSHHHPEIDTGVHTLMVLERAETISEDTRVRFAALVHDVGKGTTPAGDWPRHIGHEQRGAKLIRELCRRLKVPNDHRDLAVLVARFHGLCHRAVTLKPATLLKLLEDLDALRRPERFQLFLQACEADARGRQGSEDRDYPQARFLQRVHAAVMAVTAAPLLDQGLSGIKLAEALRQHRIRTVADLERPAED
jgi:tRNA nucleotidyltransferase (CCA-adding enzyme)